VAYTLTRKAKTGVNVFNFEVRMFIHNLLWSHAICQELKHITHSNSHASDTWTPAALSLIHCDAIENLSHIYLVRESIIIHFDSLTAHW
jgi:hypothetical protein